MIQSMTTYVLFTTGACNLNCDYCGGSIDPKLVPWDVKYSIKELEDFIGEENPVIAFYGGEPLMNYRFIEEVIDSFEGARFVIQTNGTLIHKLSPDEWKKFNTILISIDGRENVTDLHRGSGSYESALRAAIYLKRWGFSGDLVARMTVTQDTDIYVDLSLIHI